MKFSRPVCVAQVQCVDSSEVVPVAPSFDDPGLPIDSRDAVLCNPTTTFGERRSPRVLFEGTCDVVLTCSTQQASALTTRKPLRRPIHPVMNDDSQRLSPTQSYSHAKPVKAFPRCSAVQHWRLRGHGAAVRRELLKNASHEPSRVRCSPNQVTRSVCAKMIGTAQVIDLSGGPAAEDPKIPNIRLVNACRRSPAGCFRRAGNCNETWAPNSNGAIKRLLLLMLLTPAGHSKKAPRHRQKRARS